MTQAMHKVRFNGDSSLQVRGAPGADKDRIALGLAKISAVAAEFRGADGAAKLNIAEVDGHPTSLDVEAGDLNNPERLRSLAHGLSKLIS